MIEYNDVLDLIHNLVQTNWANWPGFHALVDTEFELVRVVTEEDR